MKHTKIDLAKVTSVYSGRPGCQCGCRGNYYHRKQESKAVLRMIKKVVDVLNNNIENVVIEEYDDEIIYSRDVGPGPNRTYVAYVSR